MLQTFLVEPEAYVFGFICAYRRQHFLAFGIVCFVFLVQVKVIR